MLYADYVSIGKEEILVCIETPSSTTFKMRH